MNVPWHTYTTSSVFYDKHFSPRIVVGVACTLSIVGSLLIIGSYVLSKELRSQCRWILLHLSLMDFGVALANLIGIAANFDSYYVEATKNYSRPPVAVRYSCEGQAVMACFCTISSILWTISVAVYLYFRIVNQSFFAERFYKYLILFMCLANYGLPLLVTIWMGVTHRLGFAPWDSSGWCTVIVIKPPTKIHGYVSSVDKFASFFGSDLWVILTIVLIPFLYFSIKRAAKKQLLSVVTENQSMLKSKLQLIDMKFNAIPIMFVFLRVWSLIIALLYDYMELDEEDIPKPIEYILIFLSGIGDSSQGLVNGIIFVIFTQKAREVVFRRIFCCLRRRRYNQMDVNIEKSIPSFSVDKEDSFLISKSKEDSAHQKYESGGNTIYIIQSH